MARSITIFTVYTFKAKYIFDFSKVFKLTISTGAMIKRVFCLILVFLLLTTLVFAGARKAIKIEDRIYAGNLANAPEGVVIMGENGIDNTDTIEFLVNDIGYNLKVESNLPESVSFTLVGSEQAITVRIHQEASFVLADGSTVFVRYLEYERLASDIKLHLGNVGSGAQPEEDDSEETTEEETIAQEEETSANLSEETEDGTTDKQEDWKINKKYLLTAGAVVVLVLIILGLAVLFKRRKKNKITKKESNSEKKDNPSTSSKPSDKKDEESFFDPVKD